MKFLILTLFTLVFSTTLSANEQLFSSLHGFWRGQGKITVNGQKEAVHCKAWVTKKEKVLGYKITCAFNGGKFTVKSKMNSLVGNEISGTWTDSYFESKGTAVGKSNSKSLKVRLSAPQEGMDPLKGTFQVKSYEGQNAHKVGATIGLGALSVVLCQGKKTCKIREARK